MSEITGNQVELSPVKQALLEIRRLNARIAELEAKQPEAVAIIGIGLRFPGANDAESFWSVLENGVDTIQEVPPDRWDIERFYSPEPQAPGKMNTRYGAFLSGIDQFDPRFFGISPREAAQMDPQQRLLLETAWEALERAGQAPDQLFGSQTGVFLGMSNSDYYRMLLNDVDGIDAYVSTGNALSVAGGRLSYTLGLHGPNLVVDTACSSSLVAIHLAVNSLRSGESRLALAAGVNLILSPELNINFSVANMLAPDGRCKTFDQAADGYVRGEGCAVLVLKLLSEALKDGDPILAVIRGSAINHDGRSGGLTAPNGPAQASVIRAALKDAGVSPEEISYVEAHGTGTSLGDPIEIGALVEALCQGRSPENPLRVGSVKTNIGHLEAAAGIAGVIKVVLALQHRQIPPHLHLKRLNPHIQLGNAPVEFPTCNVDWRVADGKKRLAGVSSFGLSGTNAHLILEEAPEQPQTGAQAGPDRSLHLLALSAKSEPALKMLASRVAEHLDRNAGQRIEDVCFSANTGQAQFHHRLVVQARSREEALEGLVAWQAGREAPNVLRGNVRPSARPEITFLFTGQGASYQNMGRCLYESQPVFREMMDTCDRLLRPHLELPLLSVLYPSSSGDHHPLLQDMRYGQPALFVLQMALAELWKSWGVEPAFVAGHSMGEFSAACLAGVFSLEDGLKLVAGRGQVMETIAKKGQMAVVFAPASQVAEAIAAYEDRVSIAAYNAPANTVISGEQGVVDAILQQFEQQGVKIRRLAISQASHSPLIEPALEAFGRLAETVRYAAPRIGLVSTLTGKLAQPGEITRPEYWQKHLRQPVQFAQAMDTLRSHGQQIFVELGPHPVLVSLGKQCLPDESNLWLPSLRENQDAWQRMLDSLAALWLAGVRIDWRGFDRPYARRRVLLPTYPFERSRYWSEAVHRPESPSTASLYESAVEAARRQSQQGPLDLALPAYPAIWDVLDRLTLAYILQAFRELKLFACPGECRTIDQVLEQAHILPVYRPLLQRWLDKLVHHGLLEAQAGAYTARQPLPAQDLVVLRAQAREALAASPVIYEYVERCGERLAAVLTGAVSALETLFPDGSDRLAVGLYQDWAVSRYYGLLVRSVVEGALRALPASKPAIRILEIGAGTGATTGHVLPALPPERAKYVFTDVSNLFLSRAEDKFRAYPFVQYALLDIEKSPVEQGFPARSFDLMIATNVLHAVPSLKEAVRNTLELLAPGGLLVLNEATTHLSWFDITTGLIEGWQSFRDDVRSESPLFSAEEWLRLLSDCGFSQVAAWPEEGTPPAILGQHVIVAQAPQDGPAGTGEFSLAQAAGTGQPEPAAQVETPQEATSPWIAQLHEALPGDRLDIMLRFVRQKLGQVLRLPGTESLEREQRLMDLGLDSLMALELRTQLCRGLGLPEKALSATLAFDYPTVLALASYLLEEITRDTAVMAPPAQPELTAAGSREAEVANMSDKEIEALLIEKLNRRGR